LSIVISAAGGNIETVTPKYSSNTNDAAAKMIGISAGDLEIVGGRVVIKKSIAEAIAKRRPGTDNVEVVLLPWFESAVQSGSIAAVRIPVTGSQLYANYPSNILLLKVMSSNTGEFLKYSAAAADYGDGKFTLWSKGSETPYTGNINSGTEYDLVAFIKDGGKFDLDKTVNGTVVDPLAIVRRVQPDSGDGGGGCNAVGYILVILLAIPLLIQKKK